MYSAPGMRSSTSRTVPKSRAKLAQSSWVTPERISTGTPLGSGASSAGGGFGGELGAGGCILFEEDAEGAVLGAAGELEVDDVEAVRGRDAVGGGANCVELQGHVLTAAGNRVESKKKWALAHSSLPPLAGVLTAVSYAAERIRLQD